MSGQTQQTRFGTRVWVSLKLPKNVGVVWVPNRFYKKIAFVSMHTWVCGILGLKFRSKIARRSLRLVLALQSHGPTGCKLGAVQICFPVWRELKLFSPRCCHSESPCSDMLSRLKGIETQLPLCRAWWLSVQICLPVWRELKPSRLPWEVDCPRITGSDMLSRLKGIETMSILLLYGRQATMFRYAFPFEGNWNFSLKKKWSRSTCGSSDMLSRLKGIETFGIAIREVLV